MCKIVMTVLILLSMQSAFCGECIREKEKIYIDLEDLVFDIDCIWLKDSLEEAQVGFEALHVDSNGYYVSNQDQTWVCPKCSYLNHRPYPRYPCANCRFPYDD